MADRARVRCHRVEHEVRLDQVETWLAQRRPRAEVLTLIMKKWGVSLRHADRYIAESTERWRTHIEPEREENRRRNLSTADLVIADSFRTGKLRDVAALLRLRAALDGSLTPAPALPPAPPAELPDDPSPADLILRLCETLASVLSAADLTPEIRQTVAAMIESVEPYLSASPQDRCSGSTP